MTRLQKAATIIALALCFAGAIVGELRDASHAPQSPSQYAAAKNENKAAAKTIEERHQATEEAIATYTLWLMAFTGILAFATAGLGVFNFFQIRLARAEFLSTHRPKMRVKHLWLTSDISQPVPITANLVCVNTGAADAILGQIGVRCHIAGNERVLPADPNMAATLYLNGNRLASGLNWTLRDLNIGRILTPQEWADIQQKRAQLYCTGWISYYDGAGRLRITGFCRVLEVPQGHAVLTTANARFRICQHPDYEYQD